MSPNYSLRMLVDLEPDGTWVVLVDGASDPIRGSSWPEVYWLARQVMRGSR